MIKTATSADLARVLDPLLDPFRDEFLARVTGLAQQISAERAVNAARSVSFESRLRTLQADLSQALAQAQAAKTQVDTLSALVLSVSGVADGTRAILEREIARLERQQELLLRKHSDLLANYARLEQPQ